MAAALTMENVWKGSAAAEHVTNIAFANMDWKAARHMWKRWEDHRATWQKTTDEIIRGFDPVVICFCEVGEVSNPLQPQDFEELKNLTRQAWTSRGAAAKHVEFLHTPGTGGRT